MVYCEKFVSVLKVDGKILREIRSNGTDEVRIPFGSEYSILFKNLNSTRAAVSVSIDGEDVLDGCCLVLGPNEEHELEGFMKDNSVTNRFKFIEKTDQISEYRGDNIDDGIVRIEYRFEEKVKQNWCNNIYTQYYDSFNSDCLKKDLKVKNNIEFSSCFNDNILRNKPIKDEGITVHGSQTCQKYNNVYLGKMEENSHIIVFKLKGQIEKREKIKVVKPFLVKDKVQCSTCGIKNSSRNKFCVNCGTCLV